MKILALDPGKTTGYAVYQKLDEKWGPIRLGIQKDTKDVQQLLTEMRPDVVIIEDFRLFPWKSNVQAWSQLDTVKVIGWVECLCHLMKIDLVIQTVGNRDIGYKWGQVPKLPKSNPANHSHDAMAHAIFYIIKNGGTIESG